MAGANRGLSVAAVGGENKGLGLGLDEADLVAPAGDDRKPCSCASRILVGLVVVVAVVVEVWFMPGVARRALLGVVCWRTGLGGRER